MKQLHILPFEDFRLYSRSVFHEQGLKTTSVYLEDFPTWKYLPAHCLLHGTSLESVREQLWLWDVTVSQAVAVLPCPLASAHLAQPGHDPTVKLPPPKSAQLGPSSLLGQSPAHAIS